MKTLAVLALLVAYASAAALPADKESAPRPPSSDDLFDIFFGPLTRLASPQDEPEESSEVFPQQAAYNPFNFFFRPMTFFPAIPDFRNIFSEVASGPSSDSDTKMTNSTTEMKVVNGHKVHVNKTFYENAKTGTKIQTIFVNYSPEDMGEGEAPATEMEPTTSNESASPEPETEPETTSEEKQPDENEVREPLADHSEDNGAELSA